MTLQAVHTTPLDDERTLYHCGSCGNTNPYRFGVIQNGENEELCPECVDAEKYMDSLTA